MNRAHRLALVTALFSALPQVAEACAVCGGGNPANRTAFFLSTIALSLIPLALFAIGLMWLRSRLRDRLADEFVDRDTVPQDRATTMPVSGSRD